MFIGAALAHPSYVGLRTGRVVTWVRCEWVVPFEEHPHQDIPRYWIYSKEIYTDVQSLFFYMWESANWGRLLFCLCLMKWKKAKMNYNVLLLNINELCMCQRKRTAKKIEDCNSKENAKGLVQLLFHGVGLLCGLAGDR